jgi:hypothetical protein
MTTLQYFEPSVRIAMADEMIPLLISQGLWYELRETSSRGWQLYIPILVNKHSHHFVNLNLAKPDWLGATPVGNVDIFNMSLKQAILVLRELHVVYARLEARVLAGDWRNSDTYEIISQDCTEAELLQFVLAHC